MSASQIRTLFLNVGHFFDHMMILLYATAVISIGVEYERSYGEIIALATPGFLLFGGMSLPFGWLGDRWGRHGLITLFFIGIGTATSLTALSTSIWEVSIGLTAIGFFAAIYHPVGIPMLIQNVERPGKKIGINGVFGNMGVAAAPLIVGVIGTAYGWRGAFVIPGVICIIVGLLFWRLVPADKPEKKEKKKDSSAFDSFAPGWRHVLIVIAIVTLFGGIIFNSTTISLPKLFQERFTEALPSAIGFTALASIVYACASFVQVAAGMAIDRMPARRLLLGILCAQIIALPMLAFAEGPMLFVAALFAMASVFGQIPIIDTLVTRYVPDSHRGRVFSIKYLLNLTVGAMAVPMIASAHTWADGFSTLFQALGFVAAITAVAAFTLRRQQTVPAE